MILGRALNRSVLSNSSCSSRVTAELRGCDRKRFNSAAFIKKKGHPVTSAGGRGFTAKIVVVNRAQRCELHNLACSGGWEGQRVESCCGHFGQERLCAQL